MTEQGRVSGFPSIRSLILVSLTAGVPRIYGALSWPREPFGDAYCYVEQVSAMRGKLVAGTFSIPDLYGFWLPLYQFFCSIIAAVFNYPVYVSKMVSALAGTGVCVLVYMLTHRLTSSRGVSLAIFLAIAFDPFHVKYSSAAMTDLPHALLVMGCLYLVLLEHWTLAACLGAAACLIRLESWTLVALFPLIEFVRRRTLPILSTLILSSGPALWLLICWKATGDPLASFHAHDQYMIARLTAHPEFGFLTFDRLWNDADRLVYSMNIAVLVGCFVALWLLFRDWRKLASRESSNLSDLLICAMFFFGYFSFILTAYLSKNNTDIWPRYGLILFSLGLPVLGYAAKQIFTHSSRWAEAALATTLLIGVGQFKIHADDLIRFVTQEERAQTIALYLKQRYAADRTIKIFCDQPAVRVISGIPREQFYVSFDAPADREGFLAYLRTNGIRYLVIPEEFETSIPSQLFPKLIKDTDGVFEDVIAAPADRRADSLYRVRFEAPPPG